MSIAVTSKMKTRVSAVVQALASGHLSMAELAESSGYSPNQVTAAIVSRHMAGRVRIVGVARSHNTMYGLSSSVRPRSRGLIWWYLFGCRTSVKTRI